MIEVEIRATGDEWDAPVVVHRYRDGSLRLARALEDPEAPDGWTQRTAFPHAQVWAEGRMSPFDQARQPADPEAERLRLAGET